MVLSLFFLESQVLFFVVYISSIQSLSRVRLFETPWLAAHQASLSITISQSLLKLLSIELVMPSSHLILCRPLLLLPPIPPSIRVFSNESALRMRWPKCTYMTLNKHQISVHSDFPTAEHFLEREVADHCDL